MYQISVEIDGFTLYSLYKKERFVRCAYFQICILDTSMAKSDVELLPPIFISKHA